MTLAGRVSPFGHLRIKARLPAPRSLSQATASFIACNRQGIHHVHLVACPYNVDLWDTSRRRQPKDVIETRCVSYCRCMFDSIQSQPISASSSRTADESRCESLISTTSSNLLKNEQPYRSQRIKPESGTKHMLTHVCSLLSWCGVMRSKWWRLTGSNRRPPACKAGALPAELNPRGLRLLPRLHFLPSSCFDNAHWWVWLGSNQRPPRYQHGALTN